MNINLLRFLLPLLALAFGSLRAADDKVIAAVRAADAERVAATKAGDGARLDAIFSDDLRYAHSSGHVDTKASYIKSLTSHSTVYESYDYKEQNFSVVAPGIVLIKAGGHTPGHQMLYLRLDQGREYLLIGDVGWTLDNVTQLKLRPAATMRRINEDASALMQQLHWIKGVMDQEKLVVIPSHDDKLLQELAAKYLIGDGLMLR